MPALALLALAALQDDPDAPWTPRPSEAPDALPYEVETDADWVDQRVAAMDTGPFFSGSILTPGVPGQPQTTRGIAFRLDGGGALFDTQLLRWSAVWGGDFLALDPKRYGLVRKPTIGGEPFLWSDEAPGWALDGSFEDPRENPRVPLPPEAARFDGVHLDGDRVAVVYTVGDLVVREIVQMGWFNTSPAFVRNVHVGASEVEHRLAIPSGSALDALSDTVGRTDYEAVDADGGVVVLAPGAATEFRLFHGPAALVRFDLEELPPPPAAPGGRPRWGEPLVTRGELGEPDGAFALDTLTIPHDNPFGALFFVSGVGFLSDGRVAVCTIHGDVWLVEGADADLDELRWQRFATGLYQPLGLEVVDGRVVVLGRDRLTRLTDVNGDGEADRYENLCDRLEITGGDHLFAMDLARDPEGWLYFNKSGDRSTAHGGSVVRVSDDGRVLERFAAGRRHANGVGVSPWGVVTSADNEGEWVPATRIDVVAPGGFYGYAPAYRGEGGPEGYDPPLLWLPREADNSAGGQVWVPDDRWVPQLEGRMLHLSYGRCRALLVGGQEVGGGVQGWAVHLGPTFLSGSMRARFSPADGQLYVVGSDGWQTAARADGSLQRLRSVGGELAAPTRVELQEGGVWLDFPEPLDAASVLAPDAFAVARWDYRWASRYGSEDWSVADPEVEGRDVVAVESLNFTEDGRNVFLRLESVEPCMQMAVAYDLRTAAGAPARGTVWMTVHAVPEGARDD